MRCRSVSSSLGRCVFIPGTADAPPSATWRGRASHELLVRSFESEIDLCAAAVEGGFTRSGVLSPSLLVTLLLFMAADAGRHGYQSVLDAFWDEARRDGLDLPCARAPAAASFCNARRKLRPQALRGMLRTIAGGLLARDARRWRGMRVFAVDGSRASVGRAEELWRDCGGPTGGGTPQVQVSTLFELFGEVPLDVDVAPFAASERAQALTHLDCLRPGDLLVLDRGYPGYDFLRGLLARGLGFAARTPTARTFPAVEAFLASGALDAEIEIAAGRDVLRAHPGEDLPPLRLRAVRLKRFDGSAVVVLTTLPREGFSRKDVAALYRRRWRIEEHYKLVKSEHFGQRQFHAKTLDGVRQEIYAQALLVVVTRSLAAAARAEARRAPMRPAARVHVKAAVAAVASRLVELLLCDDVRRLAELIETLAERIRRRVEPSRPGRSCPRRSFKPCSKWHANGRRGAGVR